MPTHEHDSILSTNRSRGDQANIDDGEKAKLKTSGAPFDDTKNQKKYFQKGGRVRSRSNAPIGSLLAPATLVRKTAPGGDRGRHADTLQNMQKPVSVMDCIVRSKDDQMNRTLQLGSLENST